MKKTLSVIISLMMVFSIIAAIPFTVTATELTGDGSKDNPYLISDYAGLKAFAEKVNNNGKTDLYAILTANIVADDEAWTPIGNGSGAEDSKIKYTGTFDGDGHTITGLTTPSDYGSYAGLFGYVDKGGVIKNVGLEGGSINGIYNVGGIVGRSYGTVQNCYNTGTVNGSNFVGGIVGDDYGTVQDCYNTGEITAIASYAKVGGIIGENSCPDNGKTVKVFNCYNTGEITATGNGAYVGGIVGSNYAPGGETANVTNCYNTGAVTATADSAEVGGIVGENYAPNGGTAEVTNCYNTGAVTGTGNYAEVGGIVGQTYAPGGGTANVTNCYNTGAVTGTGSNAKVGGIVGYIYAPGGGTAKVANCYYDRNVVTVPGATSENNWNAIGENYNATVINVTGLTTVQMTGIYALTNMEFSDTFVWFMKEDVADDTNGKYYMFYPHLKGFNYDGNGAQQTGEEISPDNWPAKAEVSVDWSGSGSYTYNAAEQKPVVSSVAIGGSELTSGADYTVNYKVKNGDSWDGCTECINAGEYRAVITFGNGHPDIVKSFTINKASLKITANNQEFTYNGSNQGPGDTVYENAQEIANVITAEGLKGTDTVTQIEIDGQGKNASNDYVLTPQSAFINGTNAEDSNYDVTYVNGVLKINPAKITIAADNKETNHGEDLDNLTYKVTGDYYGEDLGISLSTDADNKTPGTYDITVSYTPNSNYNVTVQNGKYVVGDNPHTWGEITYEWNGTHCVTASRTCNYCVEVETETVDTTAEQTKDPTCTDKGENTYTATFTNPAFETQTKTVEDVEAAGHKLTHYPYTAPSSTENGNVEYWYCEQCKKYFSDENGENEITETVIPLVPEYTFDNDSLEWTKDSGEDLEFTVNRSADDDKTFGLFIGIEIDGNAVSEENYTATKGSVNIKLSADYLETLSVGEHTMKLLFTDGEAETTFTVNGKEEPAEPDGGKTDEPATEPEKNDSKPAGYEPIPKTGNGFNPLICLAVLAGPCLAAVYGRKKKEDE